MDNIQAGGRCDGTVDVERFRRMGGLETLKDSQMSLSCAVIGPVLSLGLS